jgi:hypothetical protein
MMILCGLKINQVFVILKGLVIMIGRVKLDFLPESGLSHQLFVSGVILAMRYFYFFFGIGVF